MHDTKTDTLLHKHRDSTELAGRYVTVTKSKNAKTGQKLDLSVFNIGLFYIFLVWNKKQQHFLNMHSVCNWSLPVWRSCQMRGSSMPSFCLHGVHSSENLPKWLGQNASNLIIEWNHNKNNNTTSNNHSQL